MESKEFTSPNHGIRHPQQTPHHLTTIQGHLVAASGEFVGTFFFLWLSYSTSLMAMSQAPSQAAAGGPSSLTILIIAIGYSFALLVNVWAVYRISGGLFNPAVRRLLAAQSLSTPDKPVLTIS